MLEHGETLSAFGTEIDRESDRPFLSVFLRYFQCSEVFDTWNSRSSPKGVSCQTFFQTILIRVHLRGDPVESNMKTKLLNTNKCQLQQGMRPGASWLHRGLLFSHQNCSWRRPWWQRWGGGCRRHWARSGCCWSSFAFLSCIFNCRIFEYDLYSYLNVWKSFWKTSNISQI